MVLDIQFVLADGPHPGGDFLVAELEFHRQAGQLVVTRLDRLHHAPQENGLVVPEGFLDSFPVHKVRNDHAGFGNLPITGNPDIGLQDPAQFTYSESGGFPTGHLTPFGEEHPDRAPWVVARVTNLCLEGVPQQVQHLDDEMLEALDDNHFPIVRSVRNDTAQPVFPFQPEGEPMHDCVIVGLALLFGPAQQEMDMVAHQREGIDHHAWELEQDQGQGVDSIDIILLIPEQQFLLQLLGIDLKTRPHVFLLQGTPDSRILQGIVDNLCCFSRCFIFFLLHFAHLCV